MIVLIVEAMIGITLVLCFLHLFGVIDLRQWIRRPEPDAPAPIKKPAPPR